MGLLHLGRRDRAARSARHHSVKHRTHRVARHCGCGRAYTRRQKQGAQAQRQRPPRPDHMLRPGSGRTHLVSTSETVGAGRRLAGCGKTSCKIRHQFDFLRSDFDTCFQNLFSFQLLMSRQKVLGTTGARFG